MKNFKLNMKVVRNYITVFSTMLVLALPSWAFAASSPEGKFIKGFNAVTNFFIVISIAAGACMFSWYMFNMYFANDPMKKAEVKDNLKNVILVAVVLPVGTAIIKWFGNMMA